MIDLNKAKEIAVSSIDGIKLIKGFELEDSFVFSTDYKENNGRVTPGMPMIQVFKDSGEQRVYNEYDPRKENPYDYMDRLLTAKPVEVGD